MTYNSLERKMSQFENQPKKEQRMKFYNTCVEQMGDVLSSQTGDNGRNFGKVSVVFNVLNDGFQAVQQDADPRELCQEASVVSMSGLVMQKHLNEWKSNSAMKKFDPVIFGQKIKELAEKRDALAAGSSYINPLLVDDFEWAEDPNVVFDNENVPDNYDGVSGAGWAKLYRQHGSLLNCCHGLSVLGPMINSAEPPEQTKQKEKKVRQRREIDKETQVQLKNKTRAEHGEDEMSVSKEITYVREQLDQAFKQSKRSESAVCYYQFVIDPRSFQQTVENIFHVSVLINEGFAGLALDECENLSLFPVKNKQTVDTVVEDKSNLALKHQAVFEFDYPVYQGFIDTLKIEKPMLHADINVQDIGRV